MIQNGAGLILTITLGAFPLVASAAFDDYCPLVHERGGVVSEQTSLHQLCPRHLQVQLSEELTAWLGSSAYVAAGRIHPGYSDSPRGAYCSVRNLNKNPLTSAPQQYYVVSHEKITAQVIAVRGETGQLAVKFYLDPEQNFAWAPGAAAARAMLEMTCYTEVLYFRDILDSDESAFAALEFFQTQVVGEAVKFTLDPSAYGSGSERIAYWNSQRVLAARLRPRPVPPPPDNPRVLK